MKKLLLLPLLLSTAACATITTGQNQPLSVTSEPKGAECDIKNDKGAWYIDKTPGSVTVTRSFSDLNITCDKGKLSGETTVKSSVKGMEFGNILFGGLIGVGVDAATGAGYDYPTDINVELRKDN